MAAKAGLHIAVILLVFLSPEPMERAQIPLSHRTAAACNERKGLKCYLPPSAMLPDIPVLTEGAAPAARFLGVLLMASPSPPQLPP